MSEFFRGSEMAQTSKAHAAAAAGARLDCDLVGTCGGCPWGERDVFEQRRTKLAEVRDLCADPRMIELPTERLRDRVDLTWEGGETPRLGLYHRHERRLVDLPACPMMSSPLEEWLVEFRRHVPPIRRGSVRLRVAPDGSRGAWLDFANVDVKALFDERDYLRGLSARAFVEIGQRRKKLTWVDDRPKLIDPELRPWFETYDAEGGAIPLFGPVGGFSQSGFTANRALVSAVCEAAARSGSIDWLELFGGNGNFSFALAARGNRVEVVENEALALRGIELTREILPQAAVTATRADAYRGHLPVPAGRGVLVDPPRAGLGSTLAWIGEARPPALVYVSCFVDSFRRDADLLKKFNYRLESLVAVDQFVHSPHVEWVALFRV